MTPWFSERPNHLRRDNASSRLTRSQHAAGYQSPPTRQALAPLVSGGNVFVPTSQRVALDCSRSSDPEASSASAAAAAAEPGPLLYHWSCATAYPPDGTCLSADGSALTFRADLRGVGGSHPAQNVSLFAPPGGSKYLLTCSVEKGARLSSETVFVAVSARNATLPSIVLDSPLKPLDPSGAPVAIGGSGAVNASGARVKWIQLTGPPGEDYLDLTDDTVRITVWTPYVCD